MKRIAQKGRSSSQWWGNQKIAWIAEIVQSAQHPEFYVSVQFHHTHNQATTRQEVGCSFERKRTASWKVITPQSALITASQRKIVNTILRQPKTR